MLGQRMQSRLSRVGAEVSPLLQHRSEDDAFGELHTATERSHCALLMLCHLASTCTVASGRCARGDDPSVAAREGQVGGRRHAASQRGRREGVASSLLHLHIRTHTQHTEPKKVPPTGRTVRDAVAKTRKEKEEKGRMQRRGEEGGESSARTWTTSQRNAAASCRCSVGHLHRCRMTSTALRLLRLLQLRRDEMRLRAGATGALSMGW